jgi:hypothetical protein
MSPNENKQYVRTRLPGEKDNLYLYLTVAKSQASGVNKLGPSGGTQFEGDSDCDMDEEDYSAENLMINNAKTLSDLGILLVFQDDTNLVVSYQIHYSRSLKIFNIDE